MDTERGESSLLTLIGHLATQSVKDARNVASAQTHNSPRLTLGFESGRTKTTARLDLEASTRWARTASRCGVAWQVDSLRSELARLAQLAADTETDAQVMVHLELCNRLVRCPED